MGWFGGSIFFDWSRNKKRQFIIQNNIKFIYKFFPVSELPYILSCADIVFIGQSEALNSGLIALAATYSLPVVIPDIGCFVESAENWIYKTYTAGDKNIAVEALNSMHVELKNLRGGNIKWLASSSWEAHAGKIIVAAKEVKKLKSAM